MCLKNKILTSVYFKNLKRIFRLMKLMNSISDYEVYDPMTGAVTVVVGPAPQFPGPQPVLATLPCAPVPLQSVEWFQPQMPPPPPFTSRKKSSNSIDSQV